MDRRRTIGVEVAACRGAADDGHRDLVCQLGRQHPLAKLMRGSLSGVVEVRVESGRGTWRTMYTTKLGARVVVLAAFQKKSHEGIATPRHVLERIAQRLAVARRELES